MTYIVEIKETAESKSLLEHLRTLKYVTVKNAGSKQEKPYHFTDEEMALPTGKVPDKEEFEKWLTRTDKDKGSAAEVVRKRLIKKLRKEFPSKK